MHCKDTILRTQNNWPYSKFIPNSGICWGMDSFNAVKVVAILLIFGGVYLVTKSRSREEMEKYKAEQ